MTRLRHTGPAPTGEQDEQLTARCITGDLASIQAQVIMAAAAGLAAGAAINLDLVLEEAGQVTVDVGA